MKVANTVSLFCTCRQRPLSLPESNRIISIAFRRRRIVINPSTILSRDFHPMVLWFSTMTVCVLRRSQQPADDARFHFRCMKMRTGMPSPAIQDPQEFRETVSGSHFCFATERMMPDSCSFRYPDFTIDRTQLRPLPGLLPPASPWTQPSAASRRSPEYIDVSNIVDICSVSTGLTTSLITRPRSAPRSKPHAVSSRTAV